MTDRPSRATTIPPRIRAVVFDLDDTLVVSTVDFGRFKRLVLERLVSFGEPREAYDISETIVKTIARFEDRMMAQGMPDVELRSRLAELDRIMDAVELERALETEPLPGAKEAVMALRERGVRVGVLTRACEEYAEKVLALTGMRELVDAIEPRNSHVRPKPHPDAYLRLVTKLGVRPEETVFVGDHPIDASCAANAGVAFIAVGTGDVPEEVMNEAGCAAFLPDVGHLMQLIGRSLG